jgi:hypothetical protein
MFLCVFCSVISLDICICSKPTVSDGFFLLGNSAITCDLNIISTDNNLLLEGNEESNIKLATNNDKRVWINPEATDAKLTSNQIIYL